jgi:hypothetical protein
MAVKAEITSAEMAKTLFINKSFARRLRSRFTTVINKEARGAIDKPRVEISCLSPTGLP